MMSCNYLNLLMRMGILMMGDPSAEALCVIIYH